MRIERHKTGWWVVARGDADYPQFFSFFVDADRSAWSKWIDQAARYSNYEAAESAMQQLRERDRMRRATRKRN